MRAAWMRIWSWVCRVGWPWFFRVGWPRVFRAVEFVAFGAAIFGVAVWLAEAPDRTKERHYRAWELITRRGVQPETVGG